MSAASTMVFGAILALTVYTSYSLAAPVDYQGDPLSSLIDVFIRPACIGPIHKVKTAFTDAELISPTVPQVDDQTFLAIEYNSSAVSLGAIFNQSDVATAPSVYFVADPRKTYALIMLDPDVPTQYGPQLRHWVVSDLQPSCYRDVVRSGVTQSAYVGPTPLGDPQFHRYVFYLFEQPSTAVFPPLEGTNVTNFVVHDYVQQVGLVGPIAGNFYKVEDYGQNE